VQVFVVPAHGELHHMMQLRDGALLGNQKSPPDRLADARADWFATGEREMLRKTRSPSRHYKHILRSYSQTRFQPPLWRGLRTARGAHDGVTRYLTNPHRPLTTGRPVS
jgi:hypothetical protein